MLSLTQDVPLPLLVPVVEPVSVQINSTSARDMKVQAVIERWRGKHDAMQRVFQNNCFTNYVKSLQIRLKPAILLGLDCGFSNRFLCTQVKLTYAS